MLISYYLKKLSLILIGSLYILSSSGIAYASVTSDQRRNIEQFPYYDKTAESDTCSVDISSPIISSAIPGSTNQQTAFNYFVSKGLTAQQSAGIVGNLIAESSVNPKRVQGTHSPEGDKDNITVNGSTGYGLAQWTSAGRQQGLVTLARSRGMTIEGDINLQLDYLYQELTGGYKAAFNEIKAAPDLKTASSIFMLKVESPKDQSQAKQDQRASYSQKVFDLYSSGSTITQPANNSIYINAGNIPSAGKTVGASIYGGTYRNGVWVPTNAIQGGTPQDDNGMGNDGKPLPGRTAYAELSVSAGSKDFAALGGLPNGTRLEITYNGHAIIAEKDDVGAGGAAINGTARAIDLWWETAKLLNFQAGLGVVTVRPVAASTPLTPITGSSTVVGNPASTDTSAAPSCNVATTPAP